MYKFIFFVLSFLFIVGCQTTPDSGRVTDVGVWDGKVLMTTKRGAGSKWAYVTWVSDSSEKRMRVDVRAIMDIPIATFLLKNSQAHLWLYRENKYYKSDDPKKLFSKLIKFELDPEIFFSFLGRPKTIGSGWNCNEKKSTMSCRHQSQSLKVSLNFDSSDQRNIRVQKPPKAFRLRLQRSKVEVKDKMFKPPKSSQFEAIQI